MVNVLWKKILLKISQIYPVGYLNKEKTNFEGGSLCARINTVEPLESKLINTKRGGGLNYRTYVLLT